MRAYVHPRKTLCRRHYTKEVLGRTSFYFEGKGAKRLFYDALPSITLGMKHDCFQSNSPVLYVNFL